jgi:glycosyltransferase involved in cell wall biosynthesis
MSFTHRWAFKLFFKKDVMRADAVISISRGTSNRLMTLFGRAADAIVYPAVDAFFFPQPKTRVHEVSQLYSLPQFYLLAVATWEPRKNLELLIRTFLDMKKQGLVGSNKLVLVGGRGWKDQRLASLLLGTDSVIPLGYVPEEHLAPLYTGAALFIFPSIYEGFGMPVAEALACGTGVVASDISEIREAGGTDAIYVSPTAEGIRQGILEGLLKNKGPSVGQRNCHSWMEGAKTLAVAFMDVNSSSGSTKNGLR